MNCSAILSNHDSNNRHTQRSPMKVVITSIVLRNPLKFFALSYSAFKIRKQLRTTNYAEIKTTGFWNKHYTMTLWKNEQDLKAFAHSGAHLEAMKNTAKIAREIRTLTIDSDTLPDWQSAKSLLKEGKVYTY